MKKILALIGSPKKGETYKAVRLFEQHLSEIGEVELEYLFIKDFNLAICRGCNLCLLKGEEFCPLKDDRDIVLDKMLSADGIIFASPNYSLQVTAIMKNLLDRLAFIFHRPCFFHKASIAIITQGAYGAGKIIKYLEELCSFWGFNVVPGVGLTTPPIELSSSEKQKIDSSLKKAAKSFCRILSGPASPSPAFGRLLFFRMIRTFQSKNNKESRDYTFFKEKGWFQSGYYYETKLSPLKKLMGWVADKLTGMMSERTKAKETGYTNISADG